MVGGHRSSIGRVYVCQQKGVGFPVYLRPFQDELGSASVASLLASPDAVWIQVGPPSSEVGETQSHSLKFGRTRSPEQVGKAPQRR